VSGFARWPVLFAGLMLAAIAAAEVPETAGSPLDTRRVPLSEDPAARFGALRPLGMLEILTRHLGGARLSQLSGLAWDDDEGVLYAVSDKGVLFHLRPVLRDGRLVGLEGLKSVALRDPKTGKPLRDHQADSEGLEIVNGRNGRRGDAQLVVSFERRPRLIRYRPDGSVVGEISLPESLKRANRYASGNRMLESVCHDAELEWLTAPEAPRRDEPDGHTRIYNNLGQSWLYPAHHGSYISALECVGRRQLLVLERDFGRLLGRIEVTLRLADLPAAPGDRPVPVRTLAALSASAGHLIDNFEGLTRHRGQRYFVVSDDNDLFFQRTLLLYFELDVNP
jgi:hypothetical protein